MCDGGHDDYFVFIFGRPFQQDVTHEVGTRTEVCDYVVDLSCFCLELLAHEVNDRHEHRLNK